VLRKAQILSSGTGWDWTGGEHMCSEQYKGKGCVSKFFVKWIIHMGIEDFYMLRMEIRSERFERNLAVISDINGAKQDSIIHITSGTIPYWHMLWCESPSPVVLQVSFGTGTLLNEEVFPSSTLLSRRVKLGWPRGEVDSEVHLDSNFILNTGEIHRWTSPPKIRAVVPESRGTKLETGLG
jgi:hypothetical protein